MHCPRTLFQLVGVLQHQEEGCNHSLAKHSNIKYLKKTHNYDLHLLKSVDDALAIDRCSGSNLWADAIAKEMKNV